MTTSTPTAFAPVPVLRRELLQELQLGGLRFTESWHRALSTIDRHSHRHATITILIDGSFEELYRRRPSMACVAPAVHVRPPGEPHLDRLGEIGAHNLVLEVDDARCESIHGYSTIFDEVRSLKNPQVLTVVRAIQREMAIHDEATGLALEGLALELLGTVSRSYTRSGARESRWLRRVRDLLHDRFQDQKLRLGDLAKEASVHPVHLARTFRSCYGMSPGEYLRQLRIDWVAEKLRGSDLSLADLAVAAGFADQSHLSRAFKARIGWTPGAWRRLHR